MDVVLRCAKNDYADHHILEINTRWHKYYFVLNIQVALTCQINCFSCYSKLFKIRWHLLAVLTCFLGFWQVSVVFYDGIMHVKAVENIASVFMRLEWQFQLIVQMPANLTIYTTAVFREHGLFFSSVLKFPSHSNLKHLFLTKSRTIATVFRSLIARIT